MDLKMPMCKVFKSPDEVEEPEVVEPEEDEDVDINIDEEEI